MMINEQRAKWADTGIRAYQQEVKTDDEDVLSDFLGDIMHWCDANNYDFEAALCKAVDMYNTEKAEDYDVEA